MSKIVMIFFAAAACIQIIKPLGWPGLRYRRDAWKLAVAGFVLVVVVASIRPDTDPGAAGNGEATEAQQTRGAAQ